MSQSLEIETTEPGVVPSHGALFSGFLGLGLTSFGGTMPLARHMIVEDRRWLTDEQFTEVLGLCQFLPGGNIINTSVALGQRFHGPSGAFMAVLGLVAAPTAIVIALGAVYERFRDTPAVQHVFAGLAAAAAGLLIAMAVSMAKALWEKSHERLWRTTAVSVLCFTAIALLRLPLLPTMLVLAALHHPAMAATFMNAKLA
jgi:chromate transporter